MRRDTPGMNLESHTARINVLRDICREKKKKKNSTKKTTSKKYIDENDKHKQDSIRKYK